MHHFVHFQWNIAEFAAVCLTAYSENVPPKGNFARYSSWFEKEQTDKVVVNTDVWTDVTIGTVTTDIVTADDLNDMKENSSSSKKSSKGSNQ